MLAGYILSQDNNFMQVIISKDVARYHNYEDKTQAVTGLRHKVKERWVVLSNCYFIFNKSWCSAIVICPWGTEGAAASDKDGKVGLQCTEPSIMPTCRYIPVKPIILPK